VKLETKAEKFCDWLVERRQKYLPSSDVIANEKKSRKTFGEERELQTMKWMKVFFIQTNSTEANECRSIRGARRRHKVSRNPNSQQGLASKHKKEKLFPRLFTQTFHRLQATRRDRG
jgi:hypothetical protein